MNPLTLKMPEKIGRWKWQMIRPPKKDGRGNGPIIVGGLTVPVAAEVLGISTRTLSRFRKNPHWPGDDAPINLIRAFVVTMKKSSGRKPKNAPKKISIDIVSANAISSALNEPDEFGELAAFMGLGENDKIVFIEKTYAKLSKLQQSIISERKMQIISRIEAEMDRIYDAVAKMDLLPPQIAKLRDAFKSSNLLLPNTCEKSVPKFSLSDEKLMVLTEKNKPGIPLYDNNVFAEYEHGLISCFKLWMDRIYDAVAIPDLTIPQIDKLRDVIKSAVSTITGNNDG